MIKARVVRHTARKAPLGTHLDYLRRDGVTRDGEKARLFGPESDSMDGGAFAERCGGDRHHFRFIISPDDSLDMADLKSFTRDLAGQMEKDLGTRLDWVAVDHWNTEHPHIHLIVRGMRDDERPHFITTMHGLHSVSAYSAIMTRGEVVIAGSDTVRNYILKNYPACPPARIRLIHEGVDPAEFPYGHTPSAAWLAKWRADFPELAGKTVLALPGRLTRLKGHATFFRLLAALREDAPIGPMKASEVYSDDTEPFRKAKIPTICITSRIGTPARSNCAKVRAKRVKQILCVSGPKTGSFNFQRSHVSAPRLLLNHALIP